MTASRQNGVNIAVGGGVPCGVAPKAGMAFRAYSLLHPTQLYCNLVSLEVVEVGHA